MVAIEPDLLVVGVVPPAAGWRPGEVRVLVTTPLILGAVIAVIVGLADLEAHWWAWRPPKTRVGLWFAVTSASCLSLLISPHDLVQGLLLLAAPAMLVAKGLGGRHRALISGLRSGHPGGHVAAPLPAGAADSRPAPDRCHQRLRRSLTGPEVATPADSAAI